MASQDHVTGLVKWAAAGANRTQETTHIVTAHNTGQFDGATRQQAWHVATAATGQDRPARGKREAVKRPDASVAAEEDRRKHRKLEGWKGARQAMGSQRRQH
jgi:hypothetical protein